MKLIQLLILMLAISSCLDRDFDEPPIRINDIGFSANSSIAELKSKYVAGQFTTINDELLIHAIVVADDRSGNFYKTIVIQDSTGGIELKINRTGIYNDFPVGMKIGLKCKGLTIGDYNSLIQLGLGTYKDGNFTNLSGIENALVDQYVIKGPKYQTIIPKKKTIPAFTAQDLSTLIELDDVEFARTDTGKTYADAVTFNSVNLTITDCDDNEVILRTSGYAVFAAVKVPSANGSIKGILSRFKSDIQLYIRDVTDVNFAGVNCDGGSGGVLELISLKDVRASFNGTQTNVADKKKIRATVISDKDNMNTTGRNAHVQDATGGIVIRFSANHTFALGDELEINVSGQELSEFDGLLQINNVPLANATKIGTHTVVPSKKTISEILANFENLESTLVLVEDVNISKSSGNTFSGTCILTDATGNMEMFTRSQATFANTSFQTTKVKIVAFVNQGGATKAKQLSIRSLADITQ
jgi:hypothetical protein